MATSTWGSVMGYVDSISQIASNCNNFIQEHGEDISGAVGDYQKGEYRNLAKRAVNKAAHEGVRQVKNRWIMPKTVSYLSSAIYLFMVWIVLSIIKRTFLVAMETQYTLVNLIAFIVIGLGFEHLTRNFCFSRRNGLTDSIAFGLFNMVESLIKNYRINGSINGSIKYLVSFMAFFCISLMVYLIWIDYQMEVSIRGIFLMILKMIVFRYAKCIMFD